MENKHESEGLYEMTSQCKICPHCNKVFEAPEGLLQHVIDFPECRSQHLEVRSPISHQTESGILTSVSEPVIPLRAESTALQSHPPISSAQNTIYGTGTTKAHVFEPKELTTGAIKEEQMNELGNTPQGSNPQYVPTAHQETKSEKASFVIGIIALCFAALAAAWSLLGGACCGWAAWGWAFIGLVLSIVSLVLKRSTIGWWALGLALFAIIWVFVCALIVPVGMGGAAVGASQGLR